MWRSQDGTVVSRGYREALPGYQRDLIETALALYEITDEKGVIDWDRLRIYRGGKGER